MTATAYRDVGLPAGTYFYQVVAVDSTGNPGPASNEASAAATVGGDLSGLNGTIYFENDDNVISVREVAGGTPRTIAPGQSPNPTADGQRLFYIHENNLIVRNLANGAAQTLYTYTDGLSNLDMAADGNSYVALHQEFLAAPGVPGGTCFTFDIKLRTITPAVETFRTNNDLHTRVTLADDKLFIASTNAGFCTTVAIDSFTPPKLCITSVARQVETCLTDTKYEDPKFAPNSRTLVFVANFSGQPELWKARVGDDSTLSNFTQLTRSPANQPVAMPNWSSDGNWIVFARDVDPAAGKPTRYELFAVRSDGDRLRALGISGKDPAPAWVGSGPPGQSTANLTPQVYVSLVRKP